MNFGLRILILDEEKLDSIFPIFISDSFYTHSIQISLLAIANGNTSVHFILILNLQGMLKTIKVCIQKIFFYNFCLHAKSQMFKVITHHEKCCLSNPINSCYDHGKDFTDVMEFQTNKNFLKCSGNGKTPPNWIGFF